MYSVEGNKLTLTTIEHTGETPTIYHGYIMKFNDGSKKQLVIGQGIDGTNLGNLPDKVVGWYDYSSIKLDE